VPDEAFRKAETKRDRAGGRPTRADADSPAKDPEERIAELTRALVATRERETEFRQAAFDLNGELLRKDKEIEGVRQRLEGARKRLEAADAQTAEIVALRNRVSELERLTQTRAFRAATTWWRIKAAIRPW
jgi:predicted RNase H-like nuclease (RuvC/YqgF family)